MNNQTSNEDLTKRIVRQAINTWESQAKIVANYFNKYGDDFYDREIAPGKNRAIYLLGHLVAAQDNILPLLGKGAKQYPELEALFLTSPDRSFDNIPSFKELKLIWDTQTAEITSQMNEIAPEEWLERHTKVSAEDFALEPHRNKLSILLSRTNHMSYHAGQLALLKQEEAVA